MTQEIITISHRESPDILIQIDRNEFHDNDEKYSDHFLHVIDVILFNSYGEMIIQRRARNRKNSPYKYHTAIGGHVSWGDSPEFTVFHECIEEIGSSCYVAKSKEEFNNAFLKLHSFSNKFALISPIKSYLREFNGETPHGQVSFKDKCFLCYGIYDGPLQNLDRSVQGFELFSLEDLDKEIAENPLAFTSGMYLFYQELREDRQNFINTYCLKK